MVYHRSRLNPLLQQKEQFLIKATLRLFFSQSGFALILTAVAYGLLYRMAGVFCWELRGRRSPPQPICGPCRLGLVNRSFFIRPEQGLAEVLGIGTATCYFNALGLTVSFQDSAMGLSEEAEYPAGAFPRGHD